MTRPTFDVVVPTLLRPSLGRLLDALAASEGPLPGRIMVVADRPGRLPLLPARLADQVVLLRSARRGPAAARNAGWRAAASEWVAFLDDDVVPPVEWTERLAADLCGLPPEVAGSQGTVCVPLPDDRRPTDSHRNIKALEGARWATADMAYRRRALEAVGGFDERFTRAYREDSDLALRVLGAGYAIERGERVVHHPVGPARPWSSVVRQAGNADDALMRALHGPGWHGAAGAPRGRRARHVAITAAGVLGAVGAARGAPGLATVALGAWAAGVAELAWARIAAGPRDPAEIGAMVGTSVLLPVAATVCWLVGWARVPLLLARGGPRPQAGPPTLEPEAALG